MHKQVLISIGEEDLRVAILEDSLLAELFIEKNVSAGCYGNIYKGRIEGVVPGLQAAFVDIGHEKNAFLHFDDILAETIPGVDGDDASGAKKSGRKKTDGSRRRYDRHDIIAKRLKVGQEMLVQVIKEPISTKGPRVTSAISLPGRFLVMLPYDSQSGGISKKVEDRSERTRLRKILDTIRKKNKAFIIRTAGVGHSSESIMADV